METCYNRGCGKKFSLSENSEEACLHHPGSPVFHDAYKGWSCCKKQTIDFTEFLDIKGCTRSRHNNVKPLAPEKPKTENVDEVITYRAPISAVTGSLERADFQTVLTRLPATWSSSLKQEVEKRKAKTDSDPVAEDSDEGGVPIGTQCKNTGCKQTYLGPFVDEWECTFHPGFPIFHEGLKYWSCCQKKTMDFQTFLDQPGCESGAHIWTKKTDSQASKRVNCRYDWHQTGGQVVVAVYCKNYDPDRTTVEVNPIRLKVHIYFPDEYSSFDIDLELRGVIDISQSDVTYTPTKVEIKMKKAEPMAWAKLDIPRASTNVTTTCLVNETEEKLKLNQPRVDALDLSDL